MGQNEMAINYRARFAYRIDMWDAETTVPDAALLADLYFPAAFSMLRNAQAQTITASS